MSRTLDSVPNNCLDSDAFAERLLACLRNSAAIDTFAMSVSPSHSNPDDSKAFSRWRHCLLRPLNIPATARVLEWGCGHGVLTRYLGEIGAQVTAVASTDVVANLCAERCRDLSNVQVLREPPKASAEFDWVVLGADVQGDFAVCLQQAKLQLQTTGRLAFGVANPSGLDGPWLYSSADAKLGFSIGYEDLETALREAGYPSWSYYYPYPGLIEPRCILSEQGLLDERFDIADLLTRQYATPWRRLVRQAVKRGTLAELASDLLVVAAPSLQARPGPEGLAWSYEMQRKPQFCTETRFTRRTETSVSRYRSSVQPGSLRSAVQGPLGAVIEQRLGEQVLAVGPSIFVRGAESATMAGLSIRLRPWFDCLCELAGLPKTIPATGNMLSLADFQVPGDYLDFMPATGAGTSAANANTALEWICSASVPLGWVLTRGCARAIASAGAPAIDTETLLRTLCEQRSLCFTADEITAWAGMEQQFLALVCTVPPLLTDLLRPALHHGTDRQRNDAISVGLEQAVAERDQRIETLSRVLDERTERAAELNRTLAERDSLIMGFEENKADREAYISQLEHRLGELEHTLSDIHNSLIWRIAGPLKILVYQVRRLQAFVDLLPKLHALGGSWPGTFLLVLRTLRLERIAGLRALLRQTANPVPVLLPAAEVPAPATLPLSLPAQATLRSNADYQAWLERYDLDDASAQSQLVKRLTRLGHQPKISLLLALGSVSSSGLLSETVESVRQQWYGNWELCIAIAAEVDRASREVLAQYCDDTRIKIVQSGTETTTTSLLNAALQQVTGTYLARIEVNDKLASTALFWIAEAIKQQPAAGLVYTDEDALSAKGQRLDPRFKSGWDPDLLLAQPYLGHLAVYKADLVTHCGGFRPGYEGAEDYDLALRVSEQLPAETIVRIPRVLYHARRDSQGPAAELLKASERLQAGQRALEDHLRSKRVQASVRSMAPGAYRVDYVLPKPAPFVSLIIVAQDRLDQLRTCLSRVLEHTGYRDFEVIIVDNGSRDMAFLHYIDALSVSDSRVRVLHETFTDNLASLHNSATRHARGTVLGLLHPAVEVFDRAWLNELVSLAWRPETGAVGARIWAADSTLFHAGLVLGIGYVAGFVHQGLTRDTAGHCERACLRRDVAAVSALCLVVKRALFDEVGGLDEVHLPAVFGDVDLCLRLRELGYRSVWTPHAEVCFHGSSVHTLDNRPTHRGRFGAEVAYMKTRWGDILYNDPYYNPNLSLLNTRCELAWPPRRELLAGDAHAKSGA